MQLRFSSLSSVFHPLALAARLLLAPVLIACASSPPPAPAPTGKWVVTPDPTGADESAQGASSEPAPEPAPEPTPDPEPAPRPAAEPQVAAPAQAKPKSAAKTKQVSAATPEPAADAYAGPNPCTHAVGGKGIIDQACAKGGIKEAKNVMKAMVKKAKKQGMKFDCDSCHKDENNWALFTEDAKPKFKELLDAYNR